MTGSQDDFEQVTDVTIPTTRQSVSCGAGLDGFIPTTVTRNMSRKKTQFSDRQSGE